MTLAASGGADSEMVADLADVAARVEVAPGMLDRNLTEHGELRDTPEVADWLAALPPEKRFGFAPLPR